MSRIFGFVVGAVWLVFAFVALRRSLDGWSAGYADLGVWWGVITALLLIAASAALVGTARYRYQGPRK
jgi:hypothetical protein